MKKLIWIIFMMLSIAMGKDLVGQGHKAFKYKDYPQALKLYNQACNEGNADGCLFLGSMYDFGSGVERDKKKAGELYQKACEMGSGLGCSSLQNVQWEMQMEGH